MQYKTKFYQTKRNMQNEYVIVKVLFTSKLLHLIGLITFESNKTWKPKTKITRRRTSFAFSHFFHVQSTLFYLNRTRFSTIEGLKCHFQLHTVLGVFENCVVVQCFVSLHAKSWSVWYYRVIKTYMWTKWCFQL